MSSSAGRECAFCGLTARVVASIDRAVAIRDGFLMIPRFPGDVDDSAEGVRFVVPEKGN